MKIALILVITLLWSGGASFASIRIVGTTKPEKLEFRLRGESLKGLKVGINGTFFSVKGHTLANWVVRDGKTLYPFPWWNSPIRGVLIIFKDGKVYMGLSRSNGNKVFIDGKEVKENEVRLAIGGCSYFLRKGRLARYKEMKEEGFPDTVIKSRQFAFIAWNERDRTIALGVSYGSSLRDAGRYLKKLGYTDAIRMDGGSATGVWRPEGKFPKTTNIVAIKF